MIWHSQNVSSDSRKWLIKHLFPPSSCKKQINKQFLPSSCLVAVRFRSGIRYACVQTFFAGSVYTQWLYRSLFVLLSIFRFVKFIIMKRHFSQWWSTHSPIWAEMNSHLSLPDPGLGQTQTCGGVNPVYGNPTKSADWLLISVNCRVAANIKSPQSVFPSCKCFAQKRLHSTISKMQSLDYFLNLCPH